MVSRDIGVDRELEKILDKISRSLVKKTTLGNKKGVVVKKFKPIEKTKLVGPESKNGIYVYNKEEKLWELVIVDGNEFKPWKDGYYVIYFDNTRCPACRIYDLSWYVYIETIGRTLDNTEFVIILCNWFSGDCDSEAASKSFKEYGIKASPTTVLLEVRNGEIVRRENIRGAKDLGTLIDIINKFINFVKISQNI